MPRTAIVSVGYRLPQQYYPLGETELYLVLLALELFVSYNDQHNVYGLFAFGEICFPRWVGKMFGKMGDWKGRVTVNRLLWDVCVPGTKLRDFEYCLVSQLRLIRPTVRQATYTNEAFLQMAKDDVTK